MLTGTVCFQMTEQVIRRAFHQKIRTPSITSLHHSLSLFRKLLWKHRFDCRVSSLAIAMSSHFYISHWSSRIFCAHDKQAYSYSNESLRMIGCVLLLQKRGSLIINSLCTFFHYFISGINHSLKGNYTQKITLKNDRAKHECRKLELSSVVSLKSY